MLENRTQSVILKMDFISIKGIKGNEYTNVNHIQQENNLHFA